MADGRTRLTWIGGLAITVVVCGVAWALLGNKEGAPSTDGASEVAQAPLGGPLGGDITQRDGGEPIANTQAYDRLVEQENQRAANEASKKGGSAVPVIRSANAAPVTGQAEPQVVQSPLVVAPPVQAPPPPPELPREDAAKTSSRVQAAKNQVNLLINSWAPRDHLTFSLIPKDGAAPQSLAQGQATQQPGPAPGPTSPSTTPIRKAGDTCYATLDTAVNTDEPSPVTATIQQCGELDQAKLVGKVDVQGQAGGAQPGARPQRAVLRFTAINVRGQPTSLPLDAVAIDESTRRSALASDVDNHYFLRYGTMFASSFLAGIGDALLRAQRQTVIATTTGPIVSRDAFDTTQLALAGAAQVGRQITSSSSGVFNRPPTITIDAGIGIGILFMTDLTLK